STAHSSQYQYIPALALPKHDELNLKLNNPPSFRDPKSVLVIGLPPVRPTLPPPLRAVDAAQISCLSKPDLVLTADGAPLVYATEMAHNFVLHVENGSGETRSGEKQSGADSIFQPSLILRAEALPSKIIQCRQVRLTARSRAFFAEIGDS